MPGVRAGTTFAMRFVIPMLLRITEERPGDLTIVHVAGRLMGEGVEELSRVCRAAPLPLRLDLAGLLQVDEIGLSLLRSLRESGAELTNESPFIQMMLAPRREHAAN